MKLSMQVTVTDLVRVLRWRGTELCEEAVAAAKPVRSKPATGNKRKPTR